MDGRVWITSKEALSLLQITSPTTLDKFILRYNIRVSKPLGKPYINKMDILGAIEKKAVKMGV